MTSSASTPCWTTDAVQRRGNRSTRRVLEIAGIVVGFIYAWPLAVAYLVWKVMGYPMPNEARAFLERNFGRAFERPFGAASPFRSSGNSAFEDYRRRELERLEEERRRLDEESRAFSEFVDELKRARDREEFDAFMARRRGGGAAPASS